jgi:hypothetical protein
MGLLNRIGTLFQSSPAPAGPTAHALDQIGATLPQLVALRGSRERLLPAVEHALAYYDRISAAIPGPVPISVADHGDDLLLGTLFPSPEEVTRGLGRSLAVRNSLSWFVDHCHDTVVAVMGMRLREISPGNIQFADHTIRSLGTDADDTRQCLAEAAFSSLLKAFAAQSAERQRQWRLTHSTKAVHQELHHRNGGNGPQQVHVAANDEPTPEHELEGLLAWLSAPEAHLRIDDGDGHALTGHQIQGNGQLHIPMLASSDRRKWLVCLVQFPLQDALRAVAEETQAHRYILI